MLHGSETWPVSRNEVALQLAEWIKTGTDPFISDRNLVSLDPIIPEFTMLDCVQQESITTQVCFTTIR